MTFIGAVGTLLSVIVLMGLAWIRAEVRYNRRTHHLLWKGVRRLYRRVNHLMAHTPGVPTYDDPPEDRLNGEEEHW